MEATEEESNARTCVYDKFTESDDVLKLIQKIDELKAVEDVQTEADILYEKFGKILDKYQEQPQLVDEHLKPFVNGLIAIIYKEDGSDLSMVKYHLAFKFLYHITKLRGHKAIVRYFPHEVTDLEPVLSFISKQSSKDAHHWQTNYMLLLWLSILVVIPFHLKTFDPNMGDSLPVMLRIFNIIKEFLPVHGITHEAAAILAARFLTRPEIKQVQLLPFVDWCLPSFEIAKAGGNVNSTFGVLLALAYIFNLGKREDVMPFGKQILEKVNEIDLTKQKHELFVKLIMKLVQRIGLSFLKNRSCLWKYSRGKSNLLNNLSGTNSTKKLEIEDNEIVEDFECDDLEVVANVIELLLTGLKDQSTNVRWSAAKGLGRITDRLSKEMGEQVVTSVMDLLDYEETNNTWHGACMALAELGRRGLILPKQLPDTIKIVSKALVYEELRGNYSIGTHVRDAACFVYWAFARAYDKQILLPYVQEMSTYLLIVALFDREINCRRAAAAAFQENVGRQGNFPNGIEIVTHVDHHAVGRRKTAFVELSKFVGQFETYRMPMAEHLVNYKVIHWDSSVRLLGSKALKNLVPLLPKEFVLQTILPKISSYCQSVDLNKKHGGIIALGYLVHGLHMKDEEIPSKVIDVVLLATEDLKQRRSHETGSELLKSAGCILIRKISIANLKLDENLVCICNGLLKDALQHLDSGIRDQAVKALIRFCDVYLKGNRPMQDTLFKYLLGELKNTEEAARCGALKALECLPESMIEADFPAVLLYTVIHYLQEKRACEIQMTNARAAAIKCISNFIINLNPMLLFGLRDTLKEIFSYFIFDALEDYTEGSRGDIGKPVRLASISSMKELIVHLHKCMPSLIDENLVSNFMVHLLPHCVSPQDEVRQVAADTFIDLIYSDVTVIPEKSKLLEICNNFSEKDYWRNASNAYALFCAILPVPVYTQCLLKGLALSVGGVSKSVMKSSREALSQSLKNLKESNGNEFIEVCEKFFDVFQENLTDKRLHLPLIITLDYLISAGLLDDLLPELISEMLNLCWNSVKRSGDIKKLLAAASLFCNSLRFTHCCKGSLKHLVELLFKKYPKVRVTTADLLYSALITYNDIVFAEDESDEKSDAAIMVLTDNDWSKPLAELTPFKVALESALCVST